MGPKTPEDCDRMFETYLNAGDAVALAALYEAHATLVLDVDYTGHAAIREALQDFIAMHPQIKMNVTKVVHAGDIAILYNDWTMSVLDGNGTRTEDRGAAIEIVRRQADGTWRYVLDDPRARG